ncbi:MAG: hypothetical protein AAF960_12340 [Bacteroidota bacterium]
MLFTADDYQRMGELGILDGKKRVELLDGEIYIKGPMTPDHNGHVDKIAEFFHSQIIRES